MATPKPGGGQPGVEADHPIVDPTKNVLDLVEAANQRQDDLRVAAKELADAKIAHQKEISDLRAAHSKEIRELDADRLEKIRQVDVSNTAIAAAQVLAAVNTLASTATVTADTLRAAGTAQATAIQNQTDRLVSGLTDRLTLVERNANIGQGRAGVADPQMEAMAATMQRVLDTLAKGSGKSEGFSQGWALLGGAILLVLAIYSGVFKAASTAQPQVIYVPAPAGSLLPTTPPQPTPR